MDSFKEYLDKLGEIGYVEKSLGAIVYVSGLPEARIYEMVIFESGEQGRIISLDSDYVEVLVLSVNKVRVGTKVARTGELLQIGLGIGLLGKTINCLGHSYSESTSLRDISEYRPIDITPPEIFTRKNVNEQFETGVAWVDLVVPVGKGQRELIIGDRKIGKTEFLLQAMYSAATKGMVCVYAAIGKTKLDIKMVEEYVKKKGIGKSSVIVASSASDPAGHIFLVPYTAMTVSEYFRDIGYNVLLVLDDMTAHAKYYREIMLLARRFPGRSSYPGDIFYIQSRLLERGGNFVHTKKNKDGTLKRVENSITCLPVAELIMGDMSGYIQTNLMAVTDGHIFFDKNLYDQGKRPAINPFLSVTRVGHQTQSILLVDASRALTSFVLQYEKLSQYMHFGSELSEATRTILRLGEEINILLEQSPEETIPMNIALFLLAFLWAGFWRDQKLDSLQKKIKLVIETYLRDKNFAVKIDNLVASSNKFGEFVNRVKIDGEFVLRIGMGDWKDG